MLPVFVGLTRGEARGSENSNNNGDGDSDSDDDDDDDDGDNDSKGETQNKYASFGNERTIREGDFPEWL